MDKKCPNLYQRARLSTGLTQERAAELLGLSVESLKQYEGGKTVPKDETVAKMVEVYHLPWLALEHAQATDTLGVMPEVTPRPLVMSSVALENRLRELTDRIRSLMRIAEDNRIDEDEQQEFDAIAEKLWDAVGAAYQVIFAAANFDAKKERPEAATSERSGEKVCGIGSTTVGCINYSTRSTLHASPNFRWEGGASL